MIAQPEGKKMRAAPGSIEKPESAGTIVDKDYLENTRLKRSCMADQAFWSAS